MPRLPDFGAIFAASPNAYMVLDRELRFVAANPAYCKLTGTVAEDLLGRRLFDAFPDDPSNPDNASTRLLRASLERVLATGKRDHLALIHYRVQREPGGPLEDRYWSATHTPILEADGTVAFVHQHTVDVTEIERLRAAASGPHSAMSAGVLDRAREVQAANALLDAELNRLRSLFEQAPGFIAILRGPQHVFEIVNDAYRAIVGTGRALLGKPVAEALPEVASQGFVELLDRVYASGTPFIGRAVKVTLGRGERGALEDRYLDFIYQPFTDAERNVAGIFVQGSDITERKALEDEREAREAERTALLAAEKQSRERAEEANRLKDEFLATVSHELRTPLTSILGWLTLVRRGQVDAERTTSALETVERNARSLAQLVDDILDVSRIISGKMSLHVSVVHVHEPVEAAVESVRPSADARDVRLQATIDSRAQIMGDAERVQQIVWNLLSNAVKFTPKGGRVQIVVRRVDSTVEIVVADNGRGIDASFLPHVFERFRQADGRSSRTHGGLGLGLSIVKHLVELHGGTISAESEGADKGACFTVRLPVALSQREVAVASPTIRADLGCPPEVVGLRVLVVEDEADTRELLREVLVGCGAHVATASTMDDALVAFDAEVPELVLSDIGMPGNDGYELIRRIRELPPERGGRVPAVALTAFARAEDRTRALRAGFKAHVPKPVDFPELLAVIASVAPTRE